MRGTRDPDFGSNSPTGRPAAARAFQLRRRGEGERAAALARELLRDRPDHPDALHLVGLAAYDRGDLKTAVRWIERAIAADDANPAYHINLGNARKAAGDLEGAVKSYEAALARRPGFPPARKNLGLALTAMGRHQEALTQFQRVLDAHPDDPEAAAHIVLPLRALDQRDAAIEHCRRALARHPENVGLLSNLGNLLREAGRPDEAESFYRRAIELQPGHPGIWNNLGNALGDLKRPAEALDAYQRATELKPAYHEAWISMGVAQMAMEQSEAAADSFRRATEIRPDFAVAHRGLGDALGKRWMLSAAADSYRRALDLDPNAETFNNLGNVLKDGGEVEEALGCYREALALQPDYVVAHDNILMTLHYLADGDIQSIAEAHARWDARHGRSLTEATSRPVRDGETGRRLAVGVVSKDFGLHPVGYILAPWLAAHDRDRLRIVCYSDRTREDRMTRRLREYADSWRDTAEMDDEALARRIREDRIDVLMDLSGHTAGNRLLVFARTPAPVQVTWAAYPDTSGLAAMDYLLCDGRAVPEGPRQWFAEIPWRLPSSYLCYAPPEAAPSPSPLPAAEAGHLTFGSFNNLAKITPAVIRLWAEILRRRPDARMILKYRAFDDPETRRRYAGWFSAERIEADRFELLGSSPSHPEHLAAYHRVDVALDPFPYNGTTTTLEALYMGVPVISLAGESFVSRQGCSMLTALGMEDWIAGSPEAYVARAVEAGRDLEALAAVRRGLRERLLSSPICDGPGFAREMETALRGMWAEGETGADSDQAGDARGSGRLLLISRRDGSVDDLPPPFAGSDWRIQRVTGTSNHDFLSDIAPASMDGLYCPGELVRWETHAVAGLLSAFGRVLRPGGTLVVEVPDLQSAGLAIAKGTEVKTALEMIYGPSDGKDGYRTGFTPGRLSRLLTGAGFRDIELTAMNGGLRAVARNSVGREDR